MRDSNTSLISIENELPKGIKESTKNERSTNYVKKYQNLKKNAKKQQKLKKYQKYLRKFKNFKKYLAKKVPKCKR